MSKGVRVAVLSSKIKRTKACQVKYGHISDFARELWALKVGYAVPSKIENSTELRVRNVLEAISTRRFNGFTSADKKRWVERVQ